MQWGKGDKHLFLHTVCRVWADYVAEEKDARKFALFEEHLRQTHGRHDHVLEKTLMQWGKGDATMLLHTVYKIWADYVTEVKDARKQAESDALMKRTHGKHDRVLEKTLLCWGKSDVELLRRTVFRAWVDDVS